MGILTITIPSAIRVPGALYPVSTPEAHSALPFRWRSLPDRIQDQGVTFLLASCFYLYNDLERAYPAAVRDLTNLYNPVFKLLVGNQVYQDVPLVVLGPQSRFELYAERYAKAWEDRGYQELLQMCPNFFMCNDHEFWNNYPESQFQVWHTRPSSAKQKLSRLPSIGIDLTPGMPNAIARQNTLAGRARPKTGDPWDGATGNGQCVDRLPADAARRRSPAASYSGYGTASPAKVKDLHSFLFSVRTDA